MDGTMYFIGISGGSGSGKTTFAKKLIKQIPHPISILHMDSYYLQTQPLEFYTKTGRPNYDHPQAFDWELLKHHISELKKGLPIDAPLYDFTKNKRQNTTHKIRPTKVILFEGIFTLYNPDIRDLLDIKCFLHVDSDIRFTRRLHRDVQERGRTLDSVIEQYYETVRPMYQKFLAPQKDYADFIVGEETDIASDILSAKLINIMEQN